VAPQAPDSEAESPAPSSATPGQVANGRNDARTLPWLAPALLSLVGVLVGGAITVGATYWTESRREADDLRVAKRLVAEEVAAIRPGLVLVVTQPRARWKNISAADLLATGAWTQNREILARELSTGEWRGLAGFYHRVAIIRRQLGPGGRAIDRDLPCTSARRLPRGCASARIARPTSRARRLHTANASRLKIRGPGWVMMISGRSG
jgi:hypothetical protein